MTFIFVETKEKFLKSSIVSKYFAVINKPSGLLTHPTNKERQNTLVNALLYKFGQNLSDTEGPEKRGIVHRLDRNTSGLLIIAKNNEAHKELTEQLEMGVTL